MPFNTNNVDSTVAANAVFGMTSAVLNGIVPASVFNDSVIRVNNILNYLHIYVFALHVLLLLVVVVTGIVFCCCYCCCV